MDRSKAVPRLVRLLEAVSIVDAPQGLTLPENIRLDSKDQPILLAAIHGKADYLLSGDAKTFRASLWKADRGRPGAFGRRSISSAGDGLENAGFALLSR